MTRKVVFAPEAHDDLDELYAWIADRVDMATVERYLQRIRRRCERLEIFSERGTKRDDIAPGLRTFGMERRVTVAFKIYEDRVAIIRVLYGGRNIEAILGDTDGAD